MNDIVPFGKYRGQPVAALVADQQYTDWLTQQDWFKARYAAIYNVVVNNNFGEPAETPEHNRYQAMFLDEKFRCAVVDVLNPKHRLEFEMGKDWWALSAKEHELEELEKETKSKRDDIRDGIQRTEEQRKGDKFWETYGPEEIKRNQTKLLEIEERTRSVTELVAEMQSKLAGSYDLEIPKVEFEVKVPTADGKVSGAADVQLTVYGCPLRIEIKPSMGDDFPAVMRQMKASACQLLYLGAYTGAGATYEQMKAMFKASRMYVLSHAEIEHHLSTSTSGEGRK